MKRKIKRALVVSLLLLTMTGCTTYLKDEDNKNVVNPHTGQNLTENILCRPTDEETIKIYEENGFDVNKLPSCVCEQEYYTESVYTGGVYTNGAYTGGEYTEGEFKCESFSITSGGYEGLWTTLFVKPLAWVILSTGKLTGNFGVGLIITSLLIRLVAYPITRKTAIQSENMKKVQPELERLEKKYAGKDQNDQQVMMAKSQEMMMLYKKYNINPLSGCLMSFLQLPLFIAFLEAINRVPAIFEETMFGLHLGTSPSIGISNGNWWYLIIILLVAVTTYFTFKNNSNGGNSDAMKQTKMMMNIFTVMIVFMSIYMTTALGIYWVTSNLFTLIQNMMAKRSNEVK